MPKVRLTIHSDENPEDVRDEAVEQLKSNKKIRIVESVIGIWGRHKRRNFEVERMFDKNE